MPVWCFCVLCLCSCVTRDFCGVVIFLYSYGKLCCCVLCFSCWCWCCCDHETLLLLQGLCGDHVLRVLCVCVPVFPETFVLHFSCVVMYGYFSCPVLRLNCVASPRSLRRSCALCLCSCVAWGSVCMAVLCCILCLVLNCGDLKITAGWWKITRDNMSAQKSIYT